MVSLRRQLATSRDFKDACWGDALTRFMREMQRLLPTPERRWYRVRSLRGLLDGRPASVHYCQLWRNELRWHEVEFSSAIRAWEFARRLRHDISRRMRVLCVAVYMLHLRAERPPEPLLLTLHAGNYRATMTIGTKMAVVCPTVLREAFRVTLASPAADLLDDAVVSD